MSATNAHLTRHPAPPAALQPLLALTAGLVFGLGLLLSGMANPAKVLAFLDLAGAWDPSLAFVMGGAIAVGLAGFGWLKQRETTLLGEPLALPSNRQIDRRLVLGSLAFGAGWGLAGYCPGPALVSAAMGQWQAWVFVVAMLAGMGLFEWLERRQGA
ncbi:YeeE/YedE family protein [Aquabacterium lacunae]|jgi:uncharacterized protein|uniref:YeeE/YedE family protein n=1 Tax=Aquabacterium lacunae TaxID=2528630 RepID=A0A4Q9H1Z3_9BURK|nr:YeeE/YedE family protein [Aquabacterium lacunae]TBO34008.1 YeeE/YedE family protein [Aquabacterium lacunae]